MELLTPTDWTDYELIDTGNREKLERFGKYTLIRPEPQAVWPKAMAEEEWEKLAHARFSRGRVGSSQSTSHHGTTAPQHHGVREERGEWIRKPEMPDQWMVGYDYNEMHLKFRLGLTAFGHIGLFPEQAENWKYIYDFIKSTVGGGQLAENTHHGTTAPRHHSNQDPVIQSSSDPVIQSSSDPVIQSSSHPVIQSSSDPVIHPPASGFRVLNLFAYTGGASLAAKAAGADVVHVDSVKQVINWAREDMENSNLDGIRWVIEDAIKFVRREVKRGNRYDGIILDPPAYGRGPDGEKWILEDSIDEMMTLCAELLEGQSPFLILSLYSMGFSSLIGENLVRSHFSNIRELQTGELCFPDRAGRNLPLGTVTRFR